MLVALKVHYEKCRAAQAEFQLSLLQRDTEQSSRRKSTRIQWKKCTSWNWRIKPIFRCKSMKRTETGNLILFKAARNFTENAACAAKITEVKNFYQ
jgi:hypothetical protein